MALTRGGHRGGGGTFKEKTNTLGGGLYQKWGDPGGIHPGSPKTLKKKYLSKGADLDKKGNVGKKTPR